MAEETLDLKLQIDESDKNVPVTQRSASNSLLLRILISTNDVVFNSLTIEDFGVLQYFFNYLTSKRKYFQFLVTYVLQVTENWEYFHFEVK